MDQFFTPPKLAHQCMTILYDSLETHFFPYPLHFIEPSAGRGAFYNLLDPNARTGFELDPELCVGTDYVQTDFLTVQELPKDRRYIAVGNPPFSCGDSKGSGRKRNVQAKFIRHCQKLGCIYIAFIVGNSLHRVREHTLLPGLQLVKSYGFPNQLFLDKNNREKHYNVSFDIYETCREPPSQRLSLREMEAKPRDWKLVNWFEDYDIAFVRWGGNVAQEAKDLGQFKEALTKTQVRYFFVKFQGVSRETFLEFLTRISAYAKSVSTITSTSISMYELYHVWEIYLSENFLNKT